MPNVPAPQSKGFLMKPRAFLVMTLAAALAAPVLAPATALADSAYLAGALAELEAAAPTGTSATSGDADLASLAECADALARSIAAGGDSAELLAVEDFSDCDPEDWYAEFVTYVSDHGIITGHEDGTFAPGSPVVRADLATILWRLAGSPKVESDGFPDLTDPGIYYYQAALWAQSTGVVGGVTHADGLQYFEGGRSVTREECAAMLARYARLCGLDTSSSGAALKTIPGWESASDWALDDLGWTVDKGLISGKQSGQDLELDPRGSTDRASMAKMVTILHRSVLAGRAPVYDGDDPQTEAERYVLSGLQSAIDLLNASGESNGTWRAYIAKPTSYWGRSFFITLESDVSFAEIRTAYKNGGETLLRIDEMAASFDALSGTIRDLSLSEGAGLDGFAVIYSSDGEVIHASRNGESYVPYWYTLE